MMRAAGLRHPIGERGARAGASPAHGPNATVAVAAALVGGGPPGALAGCRDICAGWHAQAEPIVCAGSSWEALGRGGQS